MVAWNLGSVKQRAGRSMSEQAGQVEAGLRWSWEGALRAPSAPVSIIPVTDGDLMPGLIRNAPRSHESILPRPVIRAAESGECQWSHCQPTLPTANERTPTVATAHPVLPACPYPCRRFARNKGDWASKDNNKRYWGGACVCETRNAIFSFACDCDCGEAPVLRNDFTKA